MQGVMIEETAGAPPPYSDKTEAAVPVQPELPPKTGAFNVPTLKSANSILVRKETVFKTGAFKRKTIDIISRLDLSKEVLTINQIIAGLHLVDHKARGVNAQVHFQPLGTHLVLDISGEAGRLAEDDIFLVIFDVFFNAGFELKTQYSGGVVGLKVGEQVGRENFLFQRVRTVPVFNTN